MAARIPGMATQDPTSAQVGASERTVQANAFRGVLGTGRVEAAVRAEQRRKEQLIQPDQEQQHRPDGFAELTEDGRGPHSRR